MSTKEIPFSVNRNDVRPLFNQVVDGFREAIMSGYYTSGDKIPSSRDLCPILGVSRIVTQAALEQLAAEGLVVSRPKVGTVVRDRNEKQWRGRVVFVYENGDNNYLKTMLASAMQDRLTDEGYIFSQASVGKNPDGSFDLCRLDAALSRSVDLVLVMYHRPEIYAYLAKRKIPYAVFGEAKPKPSSAVGAIHLDYNLANADFAAKCKALGVNVVLSDVWAKGGEGGEDLAREVVRLCEEEKGDFRFSYELDGTISEKIEAIVKRVYRGDGVNILPAAQKQIDQLTALGFDRLPVCMAKTQYSFTDDKSVLGAPEGFTVTIRNVKVSAGAGFIVALTGDIMTMPGLPKKPAAENIDVDENGVISGLF